MIADREALVRRETRQLRAEAPVGGGKGGERLDRIAGLIDWTALDGIMVEVCASRTGRPGWPPLVMLLAQCFSGARASP